ncbi:MAG TPA: NADPH-dependent FMN reductase [Jatrophihabitans sp.]|nr:NADPH-dependent FMN reductase [Jatrophihabitans sp.]
MVTLVLISGSLRRGSVNSALIRAAQRVAARHPEVTASSILPLHDFPPYDEDAEAVGAPLTIVRARRQVSEADGLLMATPEYNGAMSGVLKNAVDWLSRPWRSSPLTAKPVVTLSAAPGAGGGIKGQITLRPVLAELGADVVPHDLVAVPGAPDLLDADGELGSDAVLAQLEMLVDTLVARCVEIRSPVGARAAAHSP